MAVETTLAPARRVLRVDVERFMLSAFVTALLAGALAFVGLRLASPSDGTDVGGPGNPYAGGGVSVGANAGYVGPPVVAAGDRIVAMFGIQIEDWADSLVDPVVSRPAIRVGDPIEYRVERDGREIELVVTASRFDPITALADEWGVLVLALAIQLVGISLFARRPDEAAARALLVMGTGMFASSVPWALGMQVTDIAGATGLWLYAATAGLAYALFWSGALHFALVFPRPHPFAAPPRRLIAIAYAVPIGAQLGFIIGAGIASGHVLAALAAWMSGQAVFQVVVIVATVALMAFSYWRLADPLSRLQLRWVAGAVALAAISALVLWFGPELIVGEPLLPRNAVALLGLPFPIALAVAVERHHLFSLDTIVNRSLVYGGLTAGVVGTYAATVAMIGGLIPGNAPFAVALLGTGVVAVVALPLRARLQHSVNRLMYGDRDEPDEAIRRLGRRLEASLDPQTVLPTLVEAVADALRSPYVAIELDGEARVEAAHGEVPVDERGPRDLFRVPIVYRGRLVGRLALSPRAADEPLSAADRELLNDLARQSAPAVEAVRLTADLRRSREELVATREEERRRLRRDLHDELGPALAGSMIKLGAARSLMAADPARAGELLDGLEGDVRAMIDEIRRIAHNLRPPALDELGLAGVLRQQIETFDGGPAERRLRVSLEAPDELPPLPAAVEVAGLRIALEGLTNAARHSGARRAKISLAMEDDWLVVAVADDGIGIPEHAVPGFGLASMRERADELGGSLRLRTADAGGTIVEARLPVAPPRPS
jgi:signal transduction histidine kinase